MKKICPKCGSSKGLREYIYGMPAEPVDESKYEIGGCTEGFAENSPTQKCIDCDWKLSFPITINRPDRFSIREIYKRVSHQVRGNSLNPLRVYALDKSGGR